jgi:Zn-dependent protease with chaperone function
MTLLGQWWAQTFTLAALAWLVAVPLSGWFARVPWTTREPVAALLVWQAVGLSGGLAVLTAELTLAASGQDGPWRHRLISVLFASTSVGLPGALGLVLVSLSSLWLLGVLMMSFIRAARSRRTHRVLLELLSRPDRAYDTTFHVIDSGAPVAYALPGRDPHVVLSTAARDTFSSNELCAVLAHERAHLRQRHSILVQPFVAWERSLPFLSAPKAARRRVEQLVEMVCDDAASRAAGSAALASALTRLGAPERDTSERLDRLARRHTHLPLRIMLLGCAVFLVLLPPTLLLVAG